MQRKLSSFVVLLSLALPLGASSAELTGKITGSDGRGLGRTIVYAVSGPKLELAKKDPEVWNIRGGRLDPHIFVVQSGEPLIVSTADAVGYNVYIKFKEGVLQNRMLKPNGQTTFQTGGPELFAHASDDLGRLHGYVCVLEHQVFALTDADGSFKLTNLPAGKYTFEVAHPREGRMKREITINDEKMQIDFTLPTVPAAKTGNSPSYRSGFRRKPLLKKILKQFIQKPPSWVSI